MKLLHNVFKLMNVITSCTSITKREDAQFSIVEESVELILKFVQISKLDEGNFTCMLYKSSISVFASRETDTRRDWSRTLVETEALFQMVFT